MREAELLRERMWLSGGSPRLPALHRLWEGTTGGEAATLVSRD